MDIASIFYSLGIIFFASFFLLILGLIIFIWRLYTGITGFKKSLPTKMMGFLQSQNSAGLKALAIAFVGFLLSALKNKVSGKKQ
jgi:hypothetical protein